MVEHEPSLLFQLTIGAVMIALTVMIHALALDFIMGRVRPFKVILERTFPHFWKALLSSAVIVGIFIAHIAEIWLWAFLFYFLDTPELPTFESVLYYSTSSFTTVGFGDVVLGSEWRMLGGVESANGFILFGWSTAFIFEVLAPLYHRETEPLKRRYPRQKFLHRRKK